MEKKRVLVSACLLGECCRYDGRSKPSQKVIEFLKEFDTVPVCPECLGGLPTPRIPSEILRDRVVMEDGTDVSREFYSGACCALDIAKASGVDFAILKARSPSCGKGQVYDGSFSRKLTDGHGIFAGMMLDCGFRVFTEEEIEDIKIV